MPHTMKTNVSRQVPHQTASCLAKASSYGGGTSDFSGVATRMQASPSGTMHRSRHSTKTRKLHQQFYTTIQLFPSENLWAGPSNVRLCRFCGAASTSATWGPMVGDSLPSLLSPHLSRPHASLRLPAVCCRRPTSRCFACGDPCAAVCSLGTLATSSIAGARSPDARLSSPSDPRARRRPSRLRH